MSATTAVHSCMSCITSNTLGVAALTNAWCPQLISSSKNRHCAVKSSNQQLKLDAVSKQATGALHRKARLCDGGTGESDVSRRSGILSRRLTVVAVSDQDEALPQSVDLPVVKVKFVLQKECLFGQKFSVVGEDTVLGAWDPKKAFDLEWSNDHTWSGELDLPVRKKYEFKFVLIDEDGVVHWQPGPNCTFETSENTSSVVVSEPWFSEEPDKVVDAPVDVTEVLNILEDKEASNFDAEIEAAQEIIDEKPHLFESGNDFAVTAPIDMAVALASGKTEKQNS